MNLSPRYETALVWFRRDLRDYDHAALANALAVAGKVYCAFVFDRAILDALPTRRDRRVTFIHASLQELNDVLQQRGGGLIVLHGYAREEIPRLARQLGVGAVFANRDIEPDAMARDRTIAEVLSRSGVAFVSPKDQVVFDESEIRTAAGKPFSIFTPYARAWLKRLNLLGCAPSPASHGTLAPPPVPHRFPELAELGFEAINLQTAGLQAGMSGAQVAWSAFRERLSRYHLDRDFPARHATSGLSPHLRFGTVSIRELVAHTARQTGAGAETWLKELIWREFYFQILAHHPRVVSQPFRAEFTQLVWNDWPEGLRAWKEGMTGYPLVDAAMRHFARTGQMHNRLRMVTASFLCKDLGIDWRLGEHHFAGNLNDFDLAANNGGWQWAASTGCDAQPWFRMFNPVTQSEKFDPEGAFIRALLPELCRVPTRHLHAPWRMQVALQQACGVIIGRDYPAPIVEHDTARQQTLARYKKNRPS